MGNNKNMRKQRGLGKHDAPLRVQYNQGSQDFRAGRVTNPFHKDTMQYREWERGFSKSYFETLKRQKEYESKRRSEQISTGEVQHV
jgi:hypothetical protein